MIILKVTMLYLQNAAIYYLVILALVFASASINAESTIKREINNKFLNEESHHATKQDSINNKYRYPFSKQKNLDIKQSTSNPESSSRLESNIVSEHINNEELLYHPQQLKQVHSSDDELTSAKIKKAKSIGNGDSLLNTVFNNIEWVETDSSSTNNDIENEISTSHHQLPNRHKQVGQNHYKCGRSQANQRMDTMNVASSSDRYSTTFNNPSRRKYRPFEIRTPRVIGGDETKPGEYPWTASIKLNNQPICGGSLINNEWILTAAHCVVGYNPRNLTIRLGAYRIKDTSEQEAFDSSISLFIVHKEYSMPRPFSNDIALLKLSQPIEYSDFILPICLPYDDSKSLFGLGSGGGHDFGGVNKITMPSNQGNDIDNEFDHNPGSNLESGQTLNNKQRDNNISNKNYINKQTDNERYAGIVISTKMTDSDIDQCFYRLEQNYLNSIGLGSQQQQQQQQQQPVATSNLQVNSKPTNCQTSSMTLAQTNVGDSTNPVVTNSANQVRLLSSNLASHDQDLAIPDHNINKGKQTEFKTQDKVFFNQKHLTNLFPDSNNINQVYSVDKKNQISSSDKKFAAQDSRQQVTFHGFDADGYVWYSLPSSFDEIKIESEASVRAKNGLSSINSRSYDSTNVDSNNQDFTMIATSSNHQKPTNTNSAARNHQYFDGFSQSHAAKPKLLPYRANTDISYPLELSNDIDDDDPTKYAGLSGTVLGWGWVRELDIEDQNLRGSPSAILQKVELPILRNSECEAWFQSQAKKITLLTSQFCAGYSSGGKDACRGDSGGPMIIDDGSNSNRYKLIGIVSAGIGCARPSLPGLYTRVASFLPWIEAQTQRYIQ